SSNTAVLFERARALGVRWMTDLECAEAGAVGVRSFVEDFAHDLDVLYLTIDLDVLPAAVAPGVSAPAGLGVHAALVAAAVRRRCHRDAGPAGRGRAEPGPGHRWAYRPHRSASGGPGRPPGCGPALTRPAVPAPAPRRAGPRPGALAYPGGFETTRRARREGASVADRRCVFIDFDGTFAHRGVAPLAHAQAVHRARANGHRVLLCTGRPASIVAPEVAEIFDGTVASAGGWVRVGDHLLQDRRFPEELGRCAVEVLQRHDIPFALETPEALLCTPCSA